MKLLDLPNTTYKRINNYDLVTTLNVNVTDLCIGNTFYKQYFNRMYH